MLSSEYGKPLYPKLRYCTRCCMPETNEGISFDEMGICTACISQEQKIHINWKEREKKLREIFEHYKSISGNNYDCIVPISGGKDSCFQLHVVKKIYKMKPLAVTFSHNWYSEVGRYNLSNILEKLSIDHIMFTPNRELVNKLARASLYKIGDACWLCHAGVGAFPLQIAVKFVIPFLVWGESVNEASGRASYFDPIKYDRDYFIKVSAKLYPEEMIDEKENITAKDIVPFKLPSIEEIENAGIVGIHLGNYIFWDSERQTEFIKKEYGWKEEFCAGHYKAYKSNECRMRGIHDHMKFIKRGFGRGTDQACEDLRVGLLTREEGFEVAKHYDQQEPDSLEEYFKIAQVTREEYYKVLKSIREGKFREID